MGEWEGRQVGRRADRRSQNLRICRFQTRMSRVEENEHFEYSYTLIRVYSKYCKFGNFRECFVKIKSSRNAEITLSANDIGNSCPSGEFLVSQMCLLTLWFAKIKFSRKILDLQYNWWWLKTRSYNCFYTMELVVTLLTNPDIMGWWKHDLYIGLLPQSSEISTSKLPQII